jgi:putative ABC transport system permease protein
MIRHLLRLVWNRKRSNLLLTAEITISFLVLFGVVLAATFYANNYRSPLGFDSGDVWLAAVDMKQQSDDYWDDEQVAKMHQLELAIRDMPEVEVSAGAFSTPYVTNYSISSIDTKHAPAEYYEIDEVTDTFPDALRMQVTEGRFFSREDDSASIPPVVINERFARALFGDEDPIGRVLNENDDSDRMRVVGVVSDYKRDGQYSAGGYVLFKRASLDDPKRRPPRNFLVRTRPGTPADFEVKLARTLQATAPDWSFEVKPLDELAERWNRAMLTPLIIVGLVAAFLMIMVGLGLMGVLWQSVTNRTQEIGLRRVQGATAVDICLQFLGELLVVCTFGLVVGAVVIVQAPLLGLTGPISGGVFASSVAIAAGLIYLLTAACGFYPSWLATRVQPVQALHYE